MVVLKILGLLDILTGIMIILFQHDLIGWRLMLSFILYLVIKGVAFKLDFATVIEIGIALYIILAMIVHPVVIVSYLAAIYLFQKGVVSLM